MGRKHLHELLTEDQEPFHLKNFIADRRSQLKTTTTTTTDALQLRKRNSIIESTSSSTAARNFCINHVCLFSFQDSPDFRKSPFLDFPSKDTRSPFNNNGAVFLHIPARTAAMLLDAATRVQKQSGSSKPKPGSSKHIGFGLFGSILRRLKDRSTRTKNSEIGTVNATPFSPTTRRSRKKRGNGDVEVNGGGDKKRLSYSCNNSRLSSADWSEKSSELETSCSSRSIHDSEEIEFVNIEREDDCFTSCENCFCSNTASPFRFSLQRSPSPTRRKPDSTSPVASPSRHFQENKENYEEGRPQEIHEDDGKEKEQCSPVSVLDPLFDDDEEEHDGGHTEHNGYDIECSYASVERAKHQLLQKLQRFERLAGLDPHELEKHMLDRYKEDEEDDEEDVTVDEEETTHEEFVREIFNHLGVGKIPWYMKKLVFDLIAEENKKEEHQLVVQRVCKRLHSWKVVELNTIDMMVETDFRSEGWKRCDEEKIKETGKDIEAFIFGFLVEELAQELVNSSDNVIFTK